MFCFSMIIFASSYFSFEPTCSFLNHLEFSYILANKLLFSAIVLVFSVSKVLYNV